MKKTFVPQNEHFETFEALVDAASNTYTLSLKSACKALKCSRDWALTYIRPHVPSIYMSNGKGQGKVNYARMVSQSVSGDDTYSNESIYLNECFFNQYIRDHVVSCQKRTKKVYRSAFVKKEKLSEYIDKIYNCMRIMENRGFDPKLMLFLETTWISYSENPKLSKHIYNSIVVPTKRTDAEFIDVPLPRTPIEDWQAVHDLMDYGDVSETIYRKLFAEGCIRIELKLPDKDGVVKKSGKVYYIPDPEPAQPAVYNALYVDDPKKFGTVVGSYFDRMLIPQHMWFKYNNFIDNYVKY